jgi:tetratricopeptide (TPR) repeat protein
LIKQHYHAMAVRLGYAVEPPLGMVSDWGNRFLHQPGKMEDALELFQLNVRNFSRSASVYQDLGEGYAQKGNLQEAISAYKRALELDSNNLQMAQRIKELQEKK